MDLYDMHLWDFIGGTEEEFMKTSKDYNFHFVQPEMNMRDTILVQKYLKQLYPDIVDLTPTKSIHDFELPSENSGGEIKVRRKHYYDKWGLDKPKYDYLLKNNYKYYVIWSPGPRYGMKGYNKKDRPELWWWDLTKHPEPEWIKTKSEATTFFGNHEEIPKMVGMLDIQYATDLTYLLYNVK
jgi:hypothetical protein